MFSEFKRLSKHSLIFGAGPVLGSLIGFILVPIYTRFLGPNDYGILEILSRSSEVVGAILGCGMGGAAIRYYHEYEEKGELAGNQVFTTSLIFLFILSSVCLTPIFLFSGSISDVLLKSPEYSLLIRLVVLTFFLDFVVNISLTAHQAKLESLRYTLLSVGKFLCAVVLNIILVVWLGLGIQGVLLSGLLSSLLCALILGPQIFGKTKSLFEYKLLKGLLSFGLPFIPGGLLMFIVNNGDRYLLNYYASSTDVGVYALGYKLAMAVPVLITAPFIKVWLPFMLEVSHRPHASEIYSKTQTYLMVILFTLCLPVAVFSREIVTLFGGSAFKAAYTVIPVVLLSYILYCSTFVSETGIYLEKKTIYKPFIFFGGAVINVGLNLLLIPGFGFMGAAWATLGAFGAIAVLTFLVGREFLLIKMEFDRLIKIVLLALFIYYGSTMIDTAMKPSVALLLKAVVSLFFPVSLFLVRFFEPEERMAMDRMRRKIQFRFAQLFA
jgi:O-antigen/teichoic acid export membrane protein